MFDFADDLMNIFRTTLRLISCCTYVKTTGCDEWAAFINVFNIAQTQRWPCSEGVCANEWSRWWEVVLGSCYLLAGHQQEAVFLSMLHLSEDVIQDQKFRPAVMEQLHLISHLQEADTHGHTEGEKRHKASQRFARFIHVYSEAFLPLLFTKQTSWSISFQTKITVSHSICVHVEWEWK